MSTISMRSSDRGTGVRTCSTHRSGSGSTGSPMHKHVMHGVPGRHRVNKSQYKRHGSARSPCMCALRRDASFADLQRLSSCSIEGREGSRGLNPVCMSSLNCDMERGQHDCLHLEGMLLKQVVPTIGLFEGPGRTVAACLSHGRTLSAREVCGSPTSLMSPCLRSACGAACVACASPLLGSGPNCQAGLDLRLPKERQISSQKSPP